MQVHSRLKAWATLFASGLAGLIFAIDYTIVNASLPIIQYELGMSFSNLQWVMTGFGLLFCSLVITMGRVGDIVGRRKVLIIGIVGFAFASYGAGSAEVPMEMVFFRILQGAFSAAIVPCGMAMSVSAFPNKHKGKILGLYNGLLGIGLALGPIIGSLIVKHFSWQWIFYFNIPVALVSLILCIVFVDESRMPDHIRIDFLGVFSLVVAISSLIYAMAQVGEIHTVNGLTFVSILTFVVATLVFIKTELTTKNPLVPFQLFKKPGYILGAITSVGAVGFSWVVIFFIPLYLHSVFSKGTELIGLWLLPMTLMTVLTPPVVGRLFDKRGGYHISVMLFVVCLVGYFLHYFLSVDAPVWFVLGLFILSGFAWGAGNGMCIPIALSAFNNTEHSGLVSGVIITISNVVGIISLALANMVFSFFESKKLKEFLNASNTLIPEDTISFSKNLLWDSGEIRELLESLSYSESDIANIIQFVRESFVYGYQRVMIFLACFSLLLLGFLLLKRREFQAIRS